MKSVVAWWAWEDLDDSEEQLVVALVALVALVVELVVALVVALVVKLKGLRLGRLWVG